MPSTRLETIALVFVAGCAVSSDLRLPEDHPANQEAAVAPPPAFSDTLQLAGIPQESTKDGSAPTTVEHAAHTAAPATNPAAQPLYACPMHPEVVSTKSDDRCPKCRMFLKPAKAPVRAQPPGTAPATPPAPHGPSGHGGQAGH